MMKSHTQLGTLLSCVACMEDVLTTEAASVNASVVARASSRTRLADLDVTRLATIGSVFCTDWIRRVREAIMQRLIEKSFRCLLIDPRLAGRLGDAGLLTVTGAADAAGLRLQACLPEWQTFHQHLAAALCVPTLPALANPFSPLLPVRAQHDSLVALGFTEPTVCLISSLSMARLTDVLALAYRGMSEVIESEGP